MPANIINRVCFRLNYELNTISLVSIHMHVIITFHWRYGVRVSTASPDIPSLWVYSLLRKNLGVSMLYSQVISIYALQLAGIIASHHHL